MSGYRARSLVFATLLAASMVLIAANGKRLLVGNDGVTASIDTAFTCGDAAPVVIESGDPEVFESESARMQSIVDTVQAVIRHECEDLGRIDITGYLKGLDQSVYIGYAEWRDRWQVKAQRTLRTEDSVTATGGGADPGAADRELAVAANRLDMTVGEVQANLLAEFGAEARYDPAVGVMRLELGGCPTGYPAVDGDAVPDTRWTCVTAAFTDRRVPTLYHFSYTQVVEGSMADVRRALIEHFGAPHARNPDAAGGERLVWTAGQGAVTEMLEASLSRSGNNVVVHVTLQDPELAGETTPAAREDSPATDFRLRL